VLYSYRNVRPFLEEHTRQLARAILQWLKSPEMGGTGGRCDLPGDQVVAVTVSNIERYDTAVKKSARGSAQLPPATQQQATPNKNLSTTSSYVLNKHGRSRKKVAL
jgi:hypothetical protein